jgi:hypothetical protein
MEAIPAKLKGSEITVFRPVFESICELTELSDDMNGFCIACGNLQEGCEPDACEYVCEECGERKVYGIEELSIMGYVKLAG